MGCLCNLFDDGNIWILVAVVAILYIICSNGLIG